MKENEKQKIELNSKGYVFEKLVYPMKVGPKQAPVGRIYLPNFLIGKRVSVIVVDQENRQDVLNAIDLRLHQNKREFKVNGQI
ncbi:MAG: hypothetical protein ACOC5T_04200 [Elusimicrobiota bacterium]